MAVITVFEPQVGGISAQADRDFVVGTRPGVWQQEHKTAALGSGSVDFTSPPLVRSYLYASNYVAQATLSGTSAENSRIIRLGALASTQLGGERAHATIGTNQFGDPDTSGIVVTVQIEASPGERTGDPVRVDLIGEASATFRTNAPPSSPPAMADYVISYQTGSQLTKDVLKGTFAATSASTANSGSFVLRIGDTFNLLMKLSADTGVPERNGWGRFVDAKLQLRMQTTLVDASPPIVTAPPKLLRAALTRNGSNGKSVTLSFDGPLDPDRARDVGNYKVSEVVAVKGRKGKAATRLVPVQVMRAVYNSRAHSVTLVPAGKHAFKLGAKVTVYAGDPGSADGIANPSGRHLAGDGRREGTDASVTAR